MTLLFVLPAAFLGALLFLFVRRRHERYRRERESVTEALEDSERRYRTLFEALTEGVALHRMVRDDGGRAVDYRFLSVNPAFFAHIGRRPGFHLPFHPSGNAHRRPQGGPRAMSREYPIVILLVEDDPAHAEIVRRSLEPFHVRKRLYHVSDGQAAMDFLLHEGAYRDPERSPRPALILLDLRLPKVDGREVLRRIKADEGLKAIPTIVLTTSSAESDLVDAYAGGAVSYLVKPLDLHDFQSLLQAFGYYWIAENRFPPITSGTAPGGIP